MAKYVPPSRREGYVPPSTSELPPPTIQPRGRGEAFRGRGAPRARGGGGGRGGWGVASSSSGQQSREGLYSKLDLSKHFTHPQNSTFTFFSYDIPFVPRPRPLEYDPTRSPLDTPLPPSPPPPPPVHPLGHLVSYIVVFHKAHPAWSTDRELWTHTNADILIADYAGPKKNFGRPIPVFKFDRVQRSLHFFEGWFVIDRITVVESHSNELKELLEAKEADKNYGRGGRSAEAWATAMRDTWIKVHLVPAPASTPHYEALKNIMTLKGGADGEVEQYMLEVGNLREELEVLKATKANK